MDVYNENDALDEEFLLLVAMAYMVRARGRVGRVRRRRVARRRAVWVRPWLLRRPEFGMYENLIQELNREDINGYKNFLRVPPELFVEMCERLGPLLEKQDTSLRKSLELLLKIAITLRYIATGKSTNLFSMDLGLLTTRSASLYQRFVRPSALSLGQTSWHYLQPQRLGLKLPMNFRLGGTFTTRLVPLTANTLESDVQGIQVPTTTTTKGFIP